MWSRWPTDFSSFDLFFSCLYMGFTQFYGSDYRYKHTLLGPMQLLCFWWILNNQTRFCSKLTLSDSYLIVVRCNALTTRLVSPLHFIGVTIYHAFLLARELIRVSLAAYCFTFYRVLRFSGVSFLQKRKSTCFPSCGSHSLFKLHICLSGLYS